MSYFSLFSYLQKKNKKDIKSYSLYKENSSNVFILEPISNIFNKVISNKSLIDVLKTNILIKGMKNKEYIENNLFKEDYNLPKMNIDSMDIYIPFYNEDLNLIYSIYQDKLNKFPYSEMIDDYSKSIVNPFTYYGYELYNSSFTNLKLISKHSKEAYFYCEELETILSITSQGGLEKEIPLFDYQHEKKSFDEIKDNLQKLMSYYHDFDRENFIDELFNSKFISHKLYDEIHSLTLKRDGKKKK